MATPRSALTISLICATTVAIVGAVGFLAVRHLAPDKQIELLVVSCANLFGTVTGAALAFLFTLRYFRIASQAAEAKNRLETTFDLYSEFNSSQMFEARIKADKLLADNLATDFQDFYDAVPPDQISPIWVVIKFYQRLWFSIKIEKVEARYIPNLFGEVFYWWYITWFETHLVPIQWDASLDVQALKKWMDANSNPEERLEWVRRAREDNKRSFG